MLPILAVLQNQGVRLGLPDHWGQSPQNQDESDASAVVHQGTGRERLEFGTSRARPEDEGCSPLVRSTARCLKSHSAAASRHDQRSVSHAAFRERQHPSRSLPEQQKEAAEAELCRPGAAQSAA